MHLSIPDTVELKDSRGSPYAGFAVHVNGVRHCVVRYRQLHHLHEQLRRDLPLSALPPFPPKKLMPLSQTQLEDRRCQLERYLQLSCQDPRVLHGVTFNGFLLGAQRETREEEEGSDDGVDTTLDVYLMNDQKVAVRGAEVLQTDEVLERVCKELGVPDDLVYFFGLFLVERRRPGGQIVVVRKLQEFESPYISSRGKNNGGTDGAKLVVRKACWDPALDERLLGHQSTLNLLYFQSVAELESGWMTAGEETRRTMANMQARGAKLEYMHAASRLKHYGYLHFEPCVCDYPCSDTPANVAIGNRELVLRIRSPVHGEKTGFFKVTKMRCWRIMTVMKRRTSGLESGVASQTSTSSSECSSSSSNVDLELSFEYLMHSGELQWITVVSSQAILMSLCLHSIVEELLSEKGGVPIRKAGDKTCSVDYPFLRRDGTVQDVPIRTGLHGKIPSDSAVATSQQNIDPSTLSSLTSRQYSVKRLSERFAAVRFREAARAAEDVLFENEMFGRGGDDANVAR